MKMEGFGKAYSRLIVVVMVMVMFLCSKTECRSPVLHRVGGGKYSWEPNINFTEWASHQHFFVGDWLYFGFDKHKYNVLQVSEKHYEKCSGKDFIENVTRGGRDVFNLTETKTYYFICNRGDYCFNGMKVAVFVEADPALPVPSSPLIISAAAPSPSNTYAHFMFASTFSLFCVLCFSWL